MPKDKRYRKGRVGGKNEDIVKESYSVSSLVTMLQELDTQADDFKIDVNVGSAFGKPNTETPVDFRVSKDLVPLSGESVGSDSTIGRSLAKMSDSHYLDPDSLQKLRIVHPEMDDYSVINSFREIRTRLLQKSNNENFVLVVASLRHNMGATFTTVNLGAAFSYEGEKTSLLIDCYPKQNGLSHLLNLDQNLGLSDYINNPGIELDEILYPTGVHRMRLIPFGSSREAKLEFLNTERMREFVGALKRRHKDRYIIINAPPLEISADAAILSKLADYVLVVVPYGRISNGRLNKAIQSLPRKKIAGVVMNNCQKYV